MESDQDFKDEQQAQDDQSTPINGETGAPESESDAGTKPTVSPKDEAVAAAHNERTVHSSFAAAMKALGARIRASIGVPEREDDLHKVADALEDDHASIADAVVANTVADPETGRLPPIVRATFAGPGPDAGVSSFGKVPDPAGVGEAGASVPWNRSGAATPPVG